MPKQTVGLNFGKGINTKVDPWQIPFGEFSEMYNSVFDTGNQLKKANGYGRLPSLPSSNYNYLTTLNNNLTAVGKTIAAYNSSSQSWVSKGNLQPCSLSTLPLVRNSINQIQCDSAIASDGSVCTVYTETNSGTTSYKYVIANSVTGQNITLPAVIPVSSGTVTGSPRVFVMGMYFIIVFTNVITAISHLQYVAISTQNLTPSANADIASSYISATTLSWDGVVFNNNLYLAYNTTTGGQSIKVTYLPLSAAIQGQGPATATTLSGSIATMISLCVDSTIGNPLVYVSYYNLGTATGFTASVDLNLVLVQTPVATITTLTVLNITSAAQNGVCSVYYEVSNAYSYDSGVKTNFINLVKVTGSSASSAVTVIRSLGLGSKAFIISGTIYFLGAYQSAFQSSYFLINGNSTQASPLISAKLAYENGGGYLTLGLPSVTSSGMTASLPYLYKDLIQSLSTNNNSQQSTAGGIYAQTGVNLVKFDLSLANVNSVEIANGLQIGGGFGWVYDGFLPVEQGFFIWPENVEASTSGTGGSIAADTYFYQAVYEWTDNQGNIQRSASSIPVSVTTTGSTSTNTVHVPTIRLTYKVSSPVKIILYRWSAAQPIYYQVTSVTSASLSSTTSDSIDIIDTFSNATILGNSQIYTTGGVVEDVNPPSSDVMTLFDTRAWLVNAEDPNQLWFSKQVIESTPVEWSDLFTLYIAPNAGVVSTTGPITALCPMDDKLLIFKPNSAYYINGTGPDNTGVPSPSYNGPVFITSTVGCANPRSLVLIPSGVMFQSEKGIWLIGRDGTSTQYIGAAVERYNSSTVTSAVSIPNSNLVKFTLDTGEMLFFDYYYEQWDVRTGAPAVSSCIYGNLHTYINEDGAAFQETPGNYLDGSNPVLMSFTTGWISLASLQGYQRFYDFQLLGRYLSPHKINVQIAYDYNESFEQALLINPLNFNSATPSPFGEQPAPFGGPLDVEQWQVNVRHQKCTAFKLKISEVYDPSLGVPAGAGFTLSGITMEVLVKAGARPTKAVNTIG